MLICCARLLHRFAASCKKFDGGSTMKKFAAALLLAAICLAPTGAFAAKRHYAMDRGPDYGPQPAYGSAYGPACGQACAPACNSCNSCGGDGCCFNPLGIVGGVVSGIGGLISGIGCGISSIFS